MKFTGSYGQNYATIISFTDNPSASSQAFGLMGNVVGSGLVFTSVALRFGQPALGTSSALQQVALMNGTASNVTINSTKSASNFGQTHDCHATLAVGS